MPTQFSPRYRSHYNTLLTDSHQFGVGLVTNANVSLGIFDYFQGYIRNTRTKNIFHCLQAMFSFLTRDEGDADKFA